MPDIRIPALATVSRNMDSQKNAAIKSFSKINQFGTPLKVMALCFMAVGCTMEPREGTAVGAAAGGVLGAGLGAIVGSQTGDPTTGLIVGGLAGSAAGASIGNGIDANEIAAEEQSELIKRQEAQLQAHRKQIAELKQSRDQGLSRDSAVSDYEEPSYPYVESSRSSSRSSGRDSRGGAESASLGGIRERTLTPDRENGSDPEATHAGAFARGVSKGTSGQDSDGDAQRVMAYTTQQGRALQGGGRSASAEPYERKQQVALRTNDGIDSRRSESAHTVDNRHHRLDSARAGDNRSSTTSADTVPDSATSPWKTIPDRGAEKTREEDTDKPHTKKPIADRAPRKSGAEADPSVGAAGSGVQVGSSSSGESGCEEAARWASRINPSDEKTDNLFKLRKAGILCPSEPKYHISLGDTFLAMKRVGDAEREYKEAVALEPQNDEAKEKLNGLKNG